MELKALGIVRRIDDLGRIVIPIEIRRANGWEPNQPLEIFADDQGGVYLKAYGFSQEKQEVLDGLNAHKQNIPDPALFAAINKAIEFIQNK